MAIINTITIPVTLVNGKATITYPLTRPKPTMVGTVTSTVTAPMNLTNSINIPITVPNDPPSFVSILSSQVAGQKTGNTTVTIKLANHVPNGRLIEVTQSISYTTGPDGTTCNLWYPRNASGTVLNNTVTVTFPLEVPYGNATGICAWEYNATDNVAVGDHSIRLVRPWNELPQHSPFVRVFSSTYSVPNKVGTGTIPVEVTWGDVGATVAKPGYWDLRLMTTYGIDRNIDVNTTLLPFIVTTPDGSRIVNVTYNIPSNTPPDQRTRLRCEVYTGEIRYPDNTVKNSITARHTVNVG